MATMQHIGRAGWGAPIHQPAAAQGWAALDQGERRLGQGDRQLDMAQGQMDERSLQALEQRLEAAYRAAPDGPGREMIGQTLGMVRAKHAERAGVEMPAGAMGALGATATPQAEDARALALEQARLRMGGEEQMRAARAYHAPQGAPPAAMPRPYSTPGMGPPDRPTPLRPDAPQGQSLADLSIAHAARLREAQAGPAGAAADPYQQARAQALGRAHAVLEAGGLTELEKMQVQSAMRTVEELERSPLTAHDPDAQALLAEAKRRLEALLEEIAAGRGGPAGQDANRIDPAQLENWKNTGYGR